MFFIYWKSLLLYVQRQGNQKSVLTWFFNSLICSNESNDPEIYRMDGVFVVDFDHLEDRYLCCSRSETTNNNRRSRYLSSCILVSSRELSVRYSSIESSGSRITSRLTSLAKLSRIFTGFSWDEYNAACRYTSKGLDICWYHNCFIDFISLLIFGSFCLPVLSVIRVEEELSTSIGLHEGFVGSYHMT